MIETGKFGRLRLSRRSVVTGLLLVALAVLSRWIWVVFGGGNVHVVLAGQVYRGAQLSPATLERLVKRHGIRTVVNLRGCSDTIPWYLHECHVAQRLNLSMEDVGFSAYRFPNKNEMRALIDVLDRAEYPIYLHCRRGADRTGVAAAAFMLLKTGTSLGEARRQLSFRYGHVPLGKPAYLNWFLDIYASWLEETGTQHTPERFRQWVSREYKGGWFESQFANFHHGPARRGEYIDCHVDACNTGIRPWQMHSVQAAGMHLNFWVRNENDLEVTRGVAGLFEATVMPGDKRRLQFAIPPLQAGRYQLFATLEDARNFHLYQTGSEPLEVEFEVH